MKKKYSHETYHPKLSPIMKIFALDNPKKKNLNSFTEMRTPSALTK